MCFVPVPQTGAVHVAQVGGYLPSYKKPWVMMHAYNSNTLELEARGSEAQSHARIYMYICISIYLYIYDI